MLEMDVTVIGISVDCLVAFINSLYHTVILLIIVMWYYPLLSYDTTHYCHVIPPISVMCYNIHYCHVILPIIVI